MWTCREHATPTLHAHALRGAQRYVEEQQLSRNHFHTVLHHPKLQRDFTNGQQHFLGNRAGGRTKHRDR